MARIRTIKPEFFRHYRLFELERETELPLRVAFAGLWCVADREGRFKWIPEELKVECLPYDDVDFARVLDALATRGFVVKYACQGREYGVIPGFTKHQVVNNRERASELPEPNDINDLTREARDDDASATRAIRKGKEGKGKEGKGKTTGADAPSYAFEGRVIKLTQADYDRWDANFKHIQLPPALTELDAFYAGEPEEKRRKWFSRCASALANKDREAASKCGHGGLIWEGRNGYHPKTGKLVSFN